MSRTLPGKVLLLLGLCLSAGFLQAVDLPQLNLRAQATVWDERIVLKDLVEQADELPAGLGELLIGIAPRAGQSQSFSRAEIQKKLQANRVNVASFTGSAQIQVQRLGQEISPQRFLPEIRSYIAARIPAQQRLAVELTSQQAITASDRLNWRIHPAKGQDFIGTVLFSLEGIDPLSGQLAVQRWLNVRVNREAQVAVSNRSLRSGEEIAANDIRYEWRILSPSTLNAFCRENPPEGRRAERMVPANQVLTPDYIRREYLVQRGVGATLTARANGVTASTPVQVLENGIQGQWVLIQNLRSSKTLRARVCGKNQLEVDIQ